jgi:hypothetical protein
MEKKEIKNTLEGTLPKDKEEIKKLRDYIEKNFKYNFKYNLCQYKNVLGYSGDKFSDEFIKLVYNMLKSWGMNQLGAKLNDFDSFKDSIIEPKNIDAIQSLQKSRKYEFLEEIDSFNTIKDEIRTLFDGLKLVDGDKPKLVTFAKTMHFFVPNLLMPIDRKYILDFFYNDQSIPKDDDEQIKIYEDIFEEIRKYSRKLTPKENYLKPNGWSRNMPKLIDNIIIAYMQIKAIALEFNKCFNNKDIESLAKLMTDDYEFIDCTHNCINGKSDNEDNWAELFKKESENKGVIEYVKLKDYTLIKMRYSICSDAQPDHVNSCIYTAKIENNKVKGWHVCRDTEENRKQLGIDVTSFTNKENK